MKFGSDPRKLGLGMEQSVEPGWKAEAWRRIGEMLFPPHKPAYLEPFPCQDSYQLRIERQRAMFLWVREQDPHLFLTLKFNRPLSEIALRDRLRRFDALLNRRFLGRRWHRYPSEDRVWYVAFVERDRDGSGALHIHYLMRLPPRLGNIAAWKLGRGSSVVLTEEVRKGCNRVAPAGDVVSFALDDGNIGPVAYALKGLKKRWNHDQWFLSTEFHPGHLRDYSRDGLRPRARAVPVHTDRS